MDNNEKFPIELLRPSIIRTIEAYRPELMEQKKISISDLDEIRRLYYTDTLKQADIGPDVRIEELVESLVSKNFMATNINEKLAGEKSFSSKVSHTVAGFFGSWLFIILMFFLVAFWLLFNFFASESDKFDPFPFAVLGLFLTGLSALQAPFILNSQKLQGEREKIKFDEDYQTNLKSELEIRNLHSKMDFYNKKIWEKLNEINKKI